MSRTIFRQTALERLSTPEQLDQALRVVDPMGWLGLASLAALVIGAVIASVTVTIGVKVNGEGVILSPGGVLDIPIESAGRLAKIEMRPGDFIRRGQIVARLDQPDLRLELELAEIEHADIVDERRRVSRFQNASAELLRSFLSQRRLDLQSSVGMVEQRLRWLKEREGFESDLARKQIITRQRIIDTRVEIGRAYEEMAHARGAMQQTEVEETNARVGRERELLALDLKVAASERRVRSLAERLARTSAVISPHDGIVAELRASTGDVIERGAALASLLPAPGTEGPAGDLEVTLYVSPHEGKKIRPGMVAHISPTAVKREEYGFIFGKVTHVAELPATAEGMMRSLKNRQLAATLSREGAPFEVTVMLDRDEVTPSGFRWSSSKGPPQRLSSGSLAAGQVVVRDLHLISVVMPALERLFDERP